jgi:hypothetical protein
MKIHFNIILPSTPGSPKLSRSFRLPYQNPVRKVSYKYICTACWHRDCIRLCIPNRSIGFTHTAEGFDFFSKFNILLKCPSDCFRFSFFIPSSHLYLRQQFVLCLNETHGEALLATSASYIRTPTYTSPPRNGLSCLIYVVVLSPRKRWYHIWRCSRKRNGFADMQKEWMKFAK